jgi:hypothetical protein
VTTAREAAFRLSRHQLNAGDEAADSGPGAHYLEAARPTA